MHRILSILGLWIAAHAAGQTDSASFLREIEIMDSLVTGDYAVAKDFPKLMRSCIELNESVHAISCKQCEGRALIMLGILYWFNGEYDNAIKNLKSGSHIAASVNDSVQWAKATNTIGNSFYYQGYYDSAISYFQQAYSVYAKMKDKKGMISTIRDISLMYHRQGNYQKTVEYILKHEEIHDELNDSPTQLADFSGMGNFFSDSLYYREKISDNLQELEQLRKVDNKLAITNTYLNLALAHNQIREYKAAARLYVKACTIQKNLGLNAQWDLAGKNYKEANMKDSCLYYHQLAKQDFPKSTYLNKLYTYELLGDAHFHFGQYDSALYNYAIALDMNTRCNNRITMAKMHWRLANVFMKLRRFNEAEEQIERGIALAMEVSLTHRRNLFLSASNLYAQTGEYQKALNFQIKYTNLADSLARLETALNLTQLLAQYKTSRKERALDFMRAENERKELVLANRQRIIIWLGSISMVLIVFTMVVVRQRNKIRKKSQALNRANKEQQVLMKEIHHRVKNNLQIISSFINIKNHDASPETNQALQQLNTRIYSLGLIHEKLYQSENIQSVRLDQYLSELCQHHIASFSDFENKVRLEFDCAPIELDPERTMTCGLICNEIITNALKHAFTKEQQEKSIRLNLQVQDGLITWLICDNGEKGTGQIQQDKTSFGLRFVNQLVTSKLNGHWELTTEKGLVIKITFAHYQDGKDQGSNH